jgi:hypothetical protein
LDCCLEIFGTEWGNMMLPLNKGKFQSVAIILLARYRKYGEWSMKRSTKITRITIFLFQNFCERVLLEFSVNGINLNVYMLFVTIIDVRSVLNLYAVIIRRSKLTIFSCPHISPHAINDTIKIFWKLTYKNYKLNFNVQNNFIYLPGNSNPAVKNFSQMKKKLS